MIGGLSAGAMAQFIASPTDLVKVRMQMEGKRKLEGRPPRYLLQLVTTFQYLDLQQRE